MEFLKVLLAMINEIVIIAISITKLRNIYGYMRFLFIAMSKKEESKATGCQANLTLLTFQK